MSLPEDEGQGDHTEAEEGADLAVKMLVEEVAVHLADRRKPAPEPEVPPRIAVPGTGGGDRRTGGDHEQTEAGHEEGHAMGPSVHGIGHERTKLPINPWPLDRRTEE